LARKTLVVYLMAGPETPELARAAVAGGADLIEIGFPFSDPLAEGPVIRRASERALRSGMRTAACLECLAAVRARVEVPLVPMTYAALLEAYGYERFVADARASGASSFIVVDLPVEHRPELRRIQLVAPTSTDDRIRRAAEQTDGWLYVVSVVGTTGARERVSPALPPLLERTRALTDVRLYVGFGIATPEHARSAAEIADGVVVGSRAVEVAERGSEALRSYVASLREAIDEARSPLSVA
jgi:tryptophan synthase alpha chain